MNKEIATDITIDPNVRFGKPIIKGTRITVEEALGFLVGGMDFDEIEREYGITKNQIKSVIAYAASAVKDEEVHAIS